MPTACVVIPVHRLCLEKYETIALERCVEILAAHPQVIVAPSLLDLRALRARFSSLQVETFADEFFAGVAGYNRLMLADEFYARFAHYDYLLIHQLDAFVFSDQLGSWCAKGYDYIGAPWLPEGPLSTVWQDVLGSIRRARARRKNQDFALQYFYAVGNGGFSLRRVAAMREALRRMQVQAAEYRRQIAAVCNEDIFFSIEANRSRRWIRAPGYREAAAFAWELQPRKAAIINRDQLPFGCHGWNKQPREQWRSVFARVGYSVDDMLDSASAAATPGVSQA